MNTRPKCCCLAAVVLILSVLPSTADAANDAVTWNSVLLEAVRTTAFPPMHAARAFAIVHTCMYDAWAAYDDVALGTRMGGMLRRPAEERTDANKRKAVSYAAYRSLVDLFPTERRLFDSEMARLGYDPRDVSSVAADVGVHACEAVLTFRHADGANQLGDRTVEFHSVTRATSRQRRRSRERRADGSRSPPAKYTLQAVLTR